jgi:hypothetical protein
MAKAVVYVRDVINGIVSPVVVTVKGNFKNDTIAKVRLTWRYQDKLKKDYKKTVVEEKPLKFYYTSNQLGFMIDDKLDQMEI